MLLPCGHDPTKSNVNGEFDITRGDCRLCYHYQTSEPYNRMFGGSGIKPHLISASRNAIFPPIRKPLACINIGAETGEQIGCPSCQGSVKVKLFNCKIYGKCSPYKALPNVKHCISCQDYRTSNYVPNAGSIRNLIYHLYPRSVENGRIWRWNIEMLKSRLSLFNGKRVIGIAVDNTTDPVEYVKSALYGTGFEFIEVPNVPSLREVTTFLQLLSKVETLDPTQVTFYGHAKGITSQSWSQGSKTWTEALYTTNLDYWPAVQKLLAEYPMVGAFKRHGFCFPESPRSTYHYSGSFRWCRNADLFKRNWKDIDQAWIGVESAPSLIFTSDEAACIMGEFNEVGLALYQKDTWDGWAGNALKTFQAQNLHNRWQPMLSTIIITSHKKPGFVHDAIKSVLQQSTDSWQLIIADSGPLLEAGEFEKYRTDPRILIMSTGQTEELRSKFCIQSLVINNIVKAGLVRGDLISYLSDDDVYDPGIIVAWQDAARSFTDQKAWYGYADRVEITEDGQVKELGRLESKIIGGKEGTLRCKIDGLQVCHRTEVKVPWPEAIETAHHADGWFLENLSKMTDIHPLSVCVGKHRHTPLSTFTQKDPNGH